MNFTGWVQTHRFSLLFLISALIVGGLAATSKLPVALFPYVTFPRVVVNIDAGDRPAERMMIEVTFPIEQAVRAVPGVRNVRSTTSRGSAEISINFDWGESRPVQGIGENTFSVRWLGHVQPQFDEHYTFHTETDGPVRLWVDGRSVINQWRNEAATVASVPVQLKANAKYEVRMEVSKMGGSAKARLFWSSPSTARTVVPQESLFPADASSVRLVAGAVREQGGGLAKGVLLTSGSLLAAPLLTADDSKVSLRVNGSEFTVSTINVAGIVFQNVAPEVASRFQGRRGVLFVNRDFVDGEFKSVQDGKVKLSSVLFGLQTYDVGSRVAAVLLRDVTPAPWRYEVKMRDGSEFLVTAIRIEADQLVLEDEPLRGYKVPARQLSELKQRSAPGASP